MLTSTDLQAIDGLIQKRTEPIVRSVDELGNEVQGLKSAVTGLQNDMVTVKKDVRKIKKDMKFVVDVFDRTDLRLRERVEHLEKLV